MTGVAVDGDFCLEKLLSQKCFPVNYTFMWAKKAMSESILGVFTDISSSCVLPLKVSYMKPHCKIFKNSWKSPWGNKEEVPETAV